MQLTRGLGVPVVQLSPQLLEGIEVKAPGQRRHYVMSFPLRFRCSLNLTQIFV